MHRGVSRKDRGGASSSVASHRRSAGLLSISTDTSLSSNSRDAQPTSAAVAAAAAATSAGAQLRSSDNLRDFKERVDSTIQQLSGLVSLLSSREGPDSSRRQPSNSSNKGDACERTAAAPCCCRCHADAAGFSPQPLVAAPPSPPSMPLPPPPQSSSSASTRRQARSSREFSAAISGTSTKPRRPVVGFGGGAAAGCFTGDISDAVDVATATRRKSGSSAGGSSLKHQQQHQQLPPQPQPQQQRAGGSLAEPNTGIRFLWYDGSQKRYSARMAELICAKSVKRLHLSVHYFRVAGEDLLLLEKDCSDDGLAFLDVDSVVAFEGLSVEKVLKLQKLGCQLRPEDLSREFAVEKGRSKYYVVPVEESGGDWRICDGAGGPKLDSLKRVLEQQELRRGSGGGGGGGGSGKKVTI